MSSSTGSLGELTRDDEAGHSGDSRPLGFVRIDVLLPSRWRQKGSELCFKIDGKDHMLVFLRQVYII